MHTRHFAIIIKLILAAWLLPNANALANNETDTTRLLIQQSLAGKQRSEADRHRDADRHPLETLQFFGLSSRHTVVEVWPGMGWYTAILAPVLKEKGVLYAAHFDPNSDISFYRTYAKNFHDKVAADPDTYGEVRITLLQPPEFMLSAPPESTDLVLTFRNVHNWMLAEKAPLFFDSMYRALKPGGILGVVEHRAEPTQTPDPLAKNGYVQEQQIMQFAQQAGFQFMARSQINANPKDTKNHAEGVWSLPPTLREGALNREHYLSIGESDRMTLKFRKPD